VRLLKWEAATDGITFSVFDGVSFASWRDWATLAPHTPDRRPARVGAAVRAAQDVGLDDRATEIFLGSHAVAQLEPNELAGLGLPARLSLAGRLLADGTLANAGSQLLVSFQRSRGRPLPRWERKGPILRASKESWTLPVDWLRLLERVEEFNRGVQTTPDDRLAAWALIRSELPDTCELDSYLDDSEIRVVRHLTIRDAGNEAGFQPELFTSSIGSGVEGEPTPEPLGDELREEVRAKLGARADAPRRVVLSRGRILVIPEDVRRVLQVVQRYAHGSEPEARAFRSNPQVFLRESLENALSEEQLEALFLDRDLGDRVRGLSLFEAQPAPTTPSGAEWIPAEPVAPADLGQVVIGGGPSDPATRPSLALNAHSNLDGAAYVAEVHERDTGPEGLQPRSLKTEPLPHQREALTWLQQRWRSGAPGALLADDMGLGKTLTSLAFLAWCREQRADSKRSPHLVVAPTGLLENWRKEHAMHLGASGLGRLTAAYGPGLAELRLLRGDGLRELQSGLPALDVEALERNDWVLTTYETLRDYQHSFGRVSWSVLVFDEVQKIKNPHSGAANAARAMNAKFRLALTGTPVENRLSDLWSIVDAGVSPGFLGSLVEFERKYVAARSPLKADPAEIHEKASALNLELTGPDVGGPVMKRRLKRDHLRGLPTKQERLLRGTMPPPQALAYQSVVAYAQKGVSGNAFLAILQRLRSISLHPNLQGYDGDDRTFIAQSSRLSSAFAVLDEIAERGERALVFTDSLQMQSILAEILQRRYRLTRPPQLINGEVAGLERQRRVEEFQSRSGFDVMLLSPKAGGVGLTLTAANHVIHLSRWWNPAVEDQSTDRVYRIGQAQAVTVYLPLAVHPAWGEASFDVLLHQLLERKRTLSQSALGSPAMTAAEEAEMYRQAISHDVAVASLGDSSSSKRKRAS
jgi:SNF2-related domain/Helicase conserved C-terminal domain